MNFTPHDYQTEGFDFLIRRLFVQDQLGAGVFADPGLGKTLIALWTAHQLRAYGECRKFLIIAPKRVATRTWPKQIAMWGFDFEYSLLVGTQEHRKKAAFGKRAEIHIINPEGVMCFLDKHKNRLDYDCIIVDESTKFKNFTSKRFRAWNRVIKRISRRHNKQVKRIILTGTPAPNCLSDLHAQIYMLDEGKALGKTLTYFREMYMEKGGYMNYQWLFREEKEEKIRRAIENLVIRFDAMDHLDMPDRVWNKVWIDLPESVAPRYRELERELFFRINRGDNVLASGGGGLYAMCRSVANGGLYEHPDFSPRITHQIHEAKTEALVDLVEELGGKSVLVAYSFDHDLERIKKAFPDAPVIKGGTPDKEADKILDDWDNQKIHVLIMQPLSTEHGLNLQYGGCNDVIWYSLPDRPESYQQLNARIWRQGIVGQVRYHHLMASDTVDVAVWDRLHDKMKREQALLEALKQYKHAKESGNCICA